MRFSCPFHCGNNQLAVSLILILDRSGRIPGVVISVSVVKVLRPVNLPLYFDMVVAANCKNKASKSIRKCQSGGISVESESISD